MAANYEVDIKKPPRTEMAVTVSVKVSPWVDIRYKVAMGVFKIAGWLMNCNIQVIREIADE